jgi:LuxR family transcriptional regulator, regulator of acetate metabolism
VVGVVALPTTSAPDARESVLERAVSAVAAVESVDMAFAATLRARSFRLGHMRGQRAGTMDGLVTEIGQGLGGKALATERPLAVPDYVQAPGITHQFDHAVAAEGLHAVFAVPIRVQGQLYGAVYGAMRRPLALGDRFLRTVVQAARAAVLTEPAPDLGGAEQAGSASTGIVLHGDELAELRSVLRLARGAVDDPAIRRRVDRTVERLGERGGANADHADPAGGVSLSARELDVLGMVALGCSNAEVARLLRLSVETVKSYLKSAMAKLDSHTRSEAVHRARCSGLLL